MRGKWPRQTRKPPCNFPVAVQPHKDHRHTACARGKLQRERLIRIEMYAGTPEFEPMLTAVLLDVGGTLWPDRLIGHPSDEQTLAQLAALVPEVHPPECLRALRAALRADDHSLVQDTHAVLAKALQVRGADEYWRDFVDLGIAHLIDAVVTSLEVGFRKPHPAMFQAGLVAASCSPAECVMVGDSELKDIAPARQLGMRAIRVNIEEPPSGSTCAHATATSLHQAESILREWAARH
jgi:beta-phosphoglucomutase-like phosphatase (HAD superfamily)